MLWIYLNIQLQLQYMLTHLCATYKTQMKKRHLWIAASQALLVSASIRTLLVLVPGRYPATCQETSQLFHSWDLLSLAHSTNLHIDLVEIKNEMSMKSINKSFLLQMRHNYFGHNHFQMSTWCFAMLILYVFLPSSYYVYCYKVLGGGPGKSLAT